MPSDAGIRKKVLGIVGSPRRDGNTEILVDEVLAGAAEAGAEIEKVFLNDLDVGPCQACDSCRAAGQCVQEDDMQALLETMQGSDVWVLGTPVYWWGPTAQFKSFFDRWYGARQVRFEGRPVVLVIPLGGGSASYARHTVGMLTDALEYLRMELVATVVAPGAYSLGAVRRHAEVMAAARRVGREVI